MQGLATLASHQCPHELGAFFYVIKTTD